MAVTKSGLAELIAEKLKVSRSRVDQCLELTFNEMIDALSKGDRIEVRGFGSFEVREYKAYSGRNPRTGEPVPVNAKRLPFFKAGGELRDRVRDGTPSSSSDSL